MVSLDTPSLDASIRRNICLRVQIFMNLKRYGYQNLKLALLQISLVGKSQCLSWYLDNGCSRHMMGEWSMFLDLMSIKGGTIAFGVMGKGKITSMCKIGIPSLASIENVLYVESLKYNLQRIVNFVTMAILCSSTKTNV